MIFAYVTILSIILILGCLPLWKSHIKLSNIVYFLSSVFVAIWVLGNLLMHQSDQFLFWNRVAYFGATWVGYFILLFVLIYPKVLFKINKIKFFLMTSFPLFLSISVFTEFIVKDMKSVSEVTFGIGNTVWGIYFLSYVVAAFYFAMKGLKLHSGKEKYQVQYMLVGLYSFFALALTTNLLLPALGYPYLYKIGPLFSVFYILFTGYSILKHRLMDVTVVIKKSTSYLGLFLVVIASLFLMNFIMEVFFPLVNQHLYFCVLIICWAVLGHPLQQFLITTAKRKFIKGYYDQDQAL